MKTNNLIYSIEGLSAEQLYQNYMAYLENHRTTRDFTPVNSPTVNAVAEQYLKEFSFKDPGTPSEAITINKFKLLVHLLILRNHGKENHTLNAKILKKVVGKNYNLMLRSLEKYGLISISNFYVLGKSSYQYTINDGYKVKIRPNTNVYVQKELQKLQYIFAKNETINISAVNRDNFLKHYQKNLDKVKLCKYNYIDYIDQLPYSQRSKVTYHEVLNKFENNVNNITVDKRNRIYSTLSRTPKLLKNFLNIKFQLDISNSHPLLFSYFLIEQYHINYSILNDIISIQYSNIILYHNGGTNLCKYLNDSTQNFIKINNIPDDVLLYIYLTATGRFWDHFKTLPQFSDIPRYLVKVKLFEEVFYSNKLTSWKRDFAKAFRSVYPNIYSKVLIYRKEAKSKTGEHLAHKMTRLESEIFRKILKRTWDAGMETVNIHDALIVLDTKKNKNVTEYQIEEIIKSVYREYGLFVTTATDYFNIQRAEEQLQVLKNNQNELLEFEYKLKDMILESTDETEQNYYFQLWEDFKADVISVEFEDGKPYVIFNN